VTLLTVALGVDVLCVVDVPAVDVPVDEVAVPPDVRVTAFVELFEARVAVVALLVVRAGSRPVTSTSAMNIHTATNRETAPPITRRRIVRTRDARAARASRALTAAASRSGFWGFVMVRFLVFVAARRA
jgi:hypothetical protein